MKSGSSSQRSHGWTGKPSDGTFEKSSSGGRSQGQDKSFSGLQVSQWLPWVTMSSHGQKTWNVTIVAPHAGSY